MQCDVAVDSDCEALVQRTLDEHGRIDILVNNAGIADFVRAEDEGFEEFRHVLAVNLSAVFVLSQLAGRHMLTRGSGSIVNIASVLGRCSPSTAGFWPCDRSPGRPHRIPNRQPAVRTSLPSLPPAAKRS